ncbi:MAG: hypothetical protein BWX47_02018 [candidate division Hyd24-12 bacterium ADurb.Bin004]|jgi:hypothetical protein|nr:MAG: hypothetical protein BWX47_02018 [candidate division Hyd24-12 bacterium ADurb.Bin004]
MLLPEIHAPFQRLFDLGDIARDERDHFDPGRFQEVLQERSDGAADESVHADLLKSADPGRPTLWKGHFLAGLFVTTEEGHGNGSVEHR